LRKGCDRRQKTLIKAGEAVKFVSKGPHKALLKERPRKSCKKSLPGESRRLGKREEKESQPVFTGTEGLCSVAFGKGQRKKGGREKKKPRMETKEGRGRGIPWERGRISFD